MHRLNLPDAWTAVPRLLGPLLILVLLFSGCWTSSSEGDALRKDVDTLKKALSEKTEKAEKDRQKLQKIMEQATSLLTRNNADVGAQVERLQTMINKLSGGVDERDNRLKELEQKFANFQAKVDVKLEGLAGNSKSAPVPESPDELFKQGSQQLRAGKHAEARRLLRHFITRYSTDKRATGAQLMLGDSYFAQQKFAPAIVEYRKIIEQRKSSAATPDALAKIGMAFYQLKFCSEARDFFSQLLKRYRRHAQAPRARKVLKLIKKYKRNRSVCRP